MSCLPHGSLGAPKRMSDDFGRLRVERGIAPRTHLRSAQLQRGRHRRPLAAPRGLVNENGGRWDADGRSTTLSSTARDDEYSLFFLVEYPRVVRTIYLMLHDRDAAQDVAQESFIELFRRWNRISRYDQPAAWVRRVAIRLAGRKLRRARALSLIERNIDVPAPVEPADIDLVKAVRRLSSAQRAAVVLFYYEDRPIAEIADILQCSVATAKVHLHRARKRLASLLGEDVADVP